ncbi:MAG: hypothetical protein A3K68_01685 [Euryarchaeota archaeon RBG_16_68_13]|nr:MAG: hypothetical protein A3K68_01685 [Euryarchaeota archaeon RBG_16_68_13]
MTRHNRSRRGCVPALKFHSLTRFFDPVMRVAFREGPMKARLVSQMAPRPGQTVLDLGCGTGTLAILLKQAEPRARVVGLDADRRILVIARAKAAAAHVDIEWDHGMAHDLPYPDGAFDAVVASLVLHHLSHEEKVQALRDVRRVLRPGGSFHAADFGVPRTASMRALARLGALLEETQDGIEGRFPSLFRDAGLDNVEETADYATPLGTIAVWRAGIA